MRDCSFMSYCPFEKSFEHLNIEQSILLFVALSLVANVLCYSALNII
jgi:hypothetical protein